MDEPKKVPVKFWVPEKTRRMFKVMAASSGLKLNEMFIEMVTAYAGFKVLQAEAGHDQGQDGIPFLAVSQHENIERVMEGLKNR